MAECRTEANPNKYILSYQALHLNFLTYSNKLMHTAIDIGFAFRKFFDPGSKDSLPVPTRRKVFFLRKLGNFTHMHLLKIWLFHISWSNKSVPPGHDSFEQNRPVQVGQQTESSPDHETIVPLSIKNSEWASIPD
jgi:hypothetical protein